MPSKEPTKSNSLIVFHKIYSKIDNDNYYGYLTEKHYRPSKPAHRAEASKAFMMWYLGVCDEIEFEDDDDIKSRIVDCPQDQGIDAVIPTHNDQNEKGLYFYQAKFYEVDVEEDAIKNMRKLWKRVRKGEDGFSGLIYDRLDSQGIFKYLNNDDVSVHFVLVTTTKLTKDAKVAFNKLANDIHADNYLNADLTLVDQSKLKKYL